MKSRSRFVQNIDRLAGSTLAQLRRQLDSLCLTAGQLGGRLSQADIGKSYIIKSLYLSFNRRNILKKSQCFLHRHIQHIVNILILILYFQGFSVISLTFADLAWYIYVRKEMHLNLQNTVTGAGFTSSALYIKTESSFLISFCLGICCCCKKISDLVKYPGISRRIGTWSTANR